MIYDDNNTVAENSFRKQLSFIGGEAVGAGTSQLFNDAAIGSEKYHNPRESGLQCSSR